MSIQTMELNFKDLRDFSDKNSDQIIPLERAVKLSLETYKAGDVSNSEIYECWATSLFQRYGPSNITVNDLNLLLDIFLSAIEEQLNDSREDVNETQNDKLIIFLNYSLELFTWIRSVAKEFGTNEITTFLCFGLSMINSYLVVTSKRTSRLNSNELLEKPLTIQNMILGILSENPQIFSFETESSHLFTKLISNLCAVGELAPKLDIKTAVDTWKSVVRLASHNIPHSQSENGSFGDIDWLKEPMSFLLNEIGRNVETVYKENSLSEPIQQIEKFLKVTNFYVRLLQKLTLDFRHVPFPVCENFLNTLALVLTPPACIADTPVHKVIMEYVMKDCRELIPFACRNELFFDHLLADRVENLNTNEAFYEVLMEVLEVAIRKNEDKCLNPRLLDAAFERNIKNAHIFLSASKYNRFIETFSALQIHFHQEQFRKTLVKCVLQDEIILALPAIDIWCTIFRLATQANRLSYFTFWRNINERFAMFSDRLPAMYVGMLLKRLYSIFPTQEKAEIWKKINARMLNNNRFLLTIGLGAIPNSSVSQPIIHHFTTELVRFLKESSNEMTVDNFYTIVKDLKLLTPISFRNDELIQMLLQYLKIAMKSKKHTILVESIYDFIGGKLEFIDNGRILEILTELSAKLSTFDACSTKLCLVRFLSRISKIPRLRKHSEEMLRILQSDELIKNFWDIERTTDNEKTPSENAKLFQEILKNGLTEKVRTTHVCVIEENMPAKKKSKTECGLILECIEDNVHKLQALVQLEGLNTANVEIFKRVVSKLQQISAIS